MLYAIQAGASGPIKLGRTEDPAARLKALQTAHHERLHVRAVWPGDRHDERRLHERFGDARLVGEWFELTPGLQAFIDGIDSSGEAPNAEMRDENARSGGGTLRRSAHVTVPKDLDARYMTMIGELREAGVQTSMKQVVRVLLDHGPGNGEHLSVLVRTWRLIRINGGRHTTGASRDCRQLAVSLSPALHQRYMSMIGSLNDAGWKVSLSEIVRDLLEQGPAESSALRQLLNEYRASPASASRAALLCEGVEQPADDQ